MEPGVTPQRNQLLREEDVTHQPPPYNSGWVTEHPVGGESPWTRWLRAHRNELLQQDWVDKVAQLAQYRQ